MKNKIKNKNKKFYKKRLKEKERKTMVSEADNVISITLKGSDSSWETYAVLPNQRGDKQLVLLSW